MELSVVIPARNEPYLSETMQDVLKKSTVSVEVIAVLDGYWEKSEQIVTDSRVKYLHNGTSLGMRESINRGVAIATGKYLLKCDAHVMFADGFDKVLIENHKTKRVQIPTRKRLDPEKWAVIQDGRHDINYLYLDKNFKGVLDKEKNKDETLAQKKIDEIEAFQGSCWFMRTKYFKHIQLLDSKNFGPMGHEAQEIYLAVKKDGGKIVRNKYTWYAHWHKEKTDITFKSDRTKARKYMAKLLKKERRIKTGFKRRQLSRMFKGVGAEIGVRSGRFSEVICQEGDIKHLYSVDPYDLPYQDVRSHRIGLKRQLKFYDQAVERLKKYNCSVIKKESLQAVQDIDYESLDFVYIDGSHQFDYVMCDIIEWSKRVKIGGIVSGHDYFKFRDADVVAAIDIYCKIHKINIQLTDERTPSWWFIKA